MMRDAPDEDPQGPPVKRPRDPPAVAHHEAADASATVTEMAAAAVVVAVAAAAVGASVAVTTITVAS